MRVLLLYVSKRQTFFFTWPNILVYSWTDPGRRTAFASPLKKNSSFQCTHANVDAVRSEIEKREPLISYALFGCFTDGRCETMTQLFFNAYLLLVTVAKMSLCLWHKITTYGQLDDFNKPFTPEEEVKADLYSFMQHICEISVWVCFGRSWSTLFSYVQNGSAVLLNQPLNRIFRMNELVEPLHEGLTSQIRLQIDEMLYTSLQSL